MPYTDIETMYVDKTEFGFDDEGDEAVDHDVNGSSVTDSAVLCLLCAAVAMAAMAMMLMALGMNGV